MPKRIQRKRVKGWRTPPGCKCVTRPGPFGNPFTAAQLMEVGYVPRGAARERQAAAVVGFYRDWLNQPERRALRNRVRDELRGYDLACFCPEGMPCHADVLLALANREG